MGNETFYCDGLIIPSVCLWNTSCLHAPPGIVVCIWEGRGGGSCEQPENEEKIVTAYLSLSKTSDNPFLRINTKTAKANCLMGGGGGNLFQTF